jgi:hypothetical protein
MYIIVMLLELEGLIGSKFRPTLGELHKGEILKLPLGRLHGKHAVRYWLLVAVLTVQFVPHRKHTPSP